MKRKKIKIESKTLFVYRSKRSLNQFGGGTTDPTTSMTTTTTTTTGII